MIKVRTAQTRKTPDVNLWPRASVRLLRFLVGALHGEAGRDGVVPCSGAGVVVLWTGIDDAAPWTGTKNAVAWAGTEDAFP